MAPLLPWRLMPIATATNLFRYAGEVGRMGPFHTPWLTFAAWIVTGMSIVLAVAWAMRSDREDRDGER